MQQSVKHKLHTSIIWWFQEISIPSENNQEMFDSIYGNVYDSKDEAFEAEIIRLLALDKPLDIKDEKFRKRFENLIEAKPHILL